MDKRELDDCLYAAITESLANSGVPISARAKARVADELTAEAVRLVTNIMKAEGTIPTAAKPAKRTRGPNKPKPTNQQPLPLPAQPVDESTPAPFGAR